MSRRAACGEELADIAEKLNLALNLALQRSDAAKLLYYRSAYAWDIIRNSLKIFAWQVLIDMHIKYKYNYLQIIYR